MADTQDIKELETALRVILTEVLPLDDLKVIAEQNKHLLELVEHHNLTLYGNGKEGLTTTVSRIDRWVTSVQNVLNSILNWALIFILGGAAVWLFILGSSHGLVK